MRKYGILESMGEVNDFLENMRTPEMRDKHYRHKHGYNKLLTDDQYNKLFRKQNGNCAICNTHQSKLNKRLFVDHNHETGLVRGLLCGKCNTLLGFANDSQEILEQAKIYLNKHE